MVVWGVLSAFYLVALVIIGMRRWEGWMVASLTNVGWIFGSVVDGVRAVELVFSVLGLVVTVVFWLRWHREQRVLDEAALEDTATPA